MTFFITPFHYTDCFSVRQIGYGGKQNAKTLLNDNLTHFPMLSYIGEYLNIISAEMTEAMMGNVSVEDAAKNIQEQVEAVIK